LKISTIIKKSGSKNGPTLLLDFGHSCFSAKRR